MNNYHVLIIDDDKTLRDLLVKYFSGYDISSATLADGMNAVSTIEQENPDIIILDLMMPGKDGFEVLRDIREQSDVPVIMLTAKGEESEKIVGLELGADDYVAKPFNPRELLARMRAVLRRQNRRTDEKQNSTEQNHPPRAVNSSEETTVSVSGLTLDTSRHILLIEDNEHELSSAEFALLHAFMTHVDKILSRDQLMTMTRGRDHESFDRTVDVHVSKLRAILKKYPAHATRIKTVWGEGYRFLP